VHGKNSLTYTNCILVPLNAYLVFLKIPVVGKFGFAALFMTGEPGTDLEGGDIFTTTRLCYRIRIVVVLSGVEVIIDLDIP